MSTGVPVLEADDPRDQTLGPRSTSPGLSRLTLLQSMRRHPFITLLPVLVFAAVAVALSVVRDPVYTTEARMSVGRFDLSQPGALGGYATATAALATTYSRAVGAQDVVQRVSRETNLDPLTVRARLEASPIPQSPVFRIQAVGPSPAEAMAVANSTSQALVDYVKESSQARNPESPALLKQFRTDQVAVVKANQKLTAAKQDLLDDDTARNRAAVADAQATFAAAQLRSNVASEAYTQSRAGASTTQSVTILSPATFSTSDRRSTFQIYLFIAVVAGLIVGIALAALVEDRNYRRSLRRHVSQR